MTGQVTIGNRLKEAMAAENVSIRELAADLGVTDGLVGKWRAGKVVPSPKNLAKLSERLNRPVSYFFELEQAA